MIETESCTSAVTGGELCSRIDGGSSLRPCFGPGGDVADPDISLVDEAWLAGGDLLDVIRATGNRDGWTEGEVICMYVCMFVCLYVLYIYIYIHRDFVELGSSV